MRKLHLSTRCFVPLIVAVFCLSASADEIRGRVTGPRGNPVADARVVLIELGRGTFTDADGRYVFPDVPPGDYHLEALRAGLGSAVAEIELAGAAEVDLALTFSAHRERIVVSATRSAAGTNETVHPVSVMEKDELIADMHPTIGEVVATRPGISSTHFGSGASRPVIRGQQGSRVKILEGGLDVGDASSTSPDHAVSADPFEAERVEILRGPSVLLYGSSASGGAVNVIDERVPEHVPPSPIGGEANLRYGSSAEEQSGGLSLHGGAGQFAWQLHAFSRETDDYDIPGHAIVGDPDNARGTLPNSAIDSDGGSVGASWIGEHGFVGLAFKRFDTRYGIPAPPETPGGDPISIDLEQRRFDLRGGWNRPSGTVRAVRAQLGSTDYEHAELEGAEVGTQFFNEAFEGRVEVLHGRGDWKGVVGMQAGSREFEAVGDEAFLPPSDTDSLALFALQELERGPARWEVGLRVESQDTRAEGQPDADFDGVSASAGVAWSIAPETTLGASLSVSERFPVAEELYADGPHLATLSFERGDPTLDRETGTGLDVGVRRTGGRLTGEISAFYTDYDDFIFEAPTGEIEDDLPVFQFAQGGAEFYGYEASGTFGIIHDERHDFDLTVSTDRVHATLDGGGPVPFIPPRSHRMELSYRHRSWTFSTGIEHVERQDRVAERETPTDSYTLVDASAGYTLVADGIVHQFLVRGRNLTDEEARVHTSRLKDVAPLAGADLSFAYRIVF